MQNDERDRLTPDDARFVEKAFANLWTGREQLNAYSRALLALAAHALGKQDEARILAENLLDGAIVDQSPDVSIVQVGAQRSEPYVMKTAHWGQDGIWRRWSEGSVEATAFALRALVAIDPDHELVEPVMNWLVKNRRGAQWSADPPEIRGGRRCPQPEPCRTADTSPGLLNGHPGPSGRPRGWRGFPPAPG